MVDRIENTDDRPFDLEGVRNRDLALEQLADGLRDDGLAIPRGPVHEHRMAGIYRRPKLIEHLLANDQVRERIPDAIAGRGPGRSLQEFQHVPTVLVERHRRDTDIVVRLEKQGGALTAGVRDAVSVRRPADHRAPPDLNLPLRLEEIERRLDYRKIQTHAT